jgi:hypothetical protein
VIELPTNQQYLDAANKLPKYRTTAEQALVDKGIAAGMQNVKNADFRARQLQRTGG